MKFESFWQLITFEQENPGIFSDSPAANLAGRACALERLSAIKFLLARAKRAEPGSFDARQAEAYEAKLKEVEEWLEQNPPI